jgi:membrane protein implicated in regulation of membrane protease activity
VTVGFVYLILFLGGFTVALVTGLVRRAVRSPRAGATRLAPAHHHWPDAATPVWDCTAAFVTAFGLASFVLHGLTSLALAQELALGAGIGLTGAVALRAWMRATGGRARGGATATTASVVSDIPPSGFGQIELLIEGTRVTMAARSEAAETIQAGSAVEVIDQRESVVTVRPLAPARH